ncbi:putative tyrosinase-like protein tyr-3 [Bulinus truncatus]|nr:putative tyrosinase-like protein tyr-3 [Bulinus truncatus]
MKDVPVDTFVANLHSWFCEHTFVNNTSAREYFYVNSNSRDYLEKLYTTKVPGTPAQNVSQRVKRQAIPLPPCVRKEYRMLTLDERIRYHDAVNALKRNTTFRPNVYDYIANVHGAQVRNIAHKGPGFLGWHRIYLRLYEYALKAMDASVCLPYWDSTLDRQLTNPFLSSIWSSEFLGTPRGEVVDGPFANWRLQSGNKLIRNVGVSDDLLITDYVSDILSRNSYDELVNNQQNYNVEVLHGSVHNYVGGVMNQLEIAANEPAFFMHHAFIDYIFERFRQRLRSRGVNPATYPQSGATGLHAPNAPTLLKSTTQADGYSDLYARGITYEPVPTCSSRNMACGNRFLVCQVSSGKCIPTTRSTPRPTPRARRSTPNQDSSDTCETPAPPTTFDLPYQNDFCSRDLCDTRQWAVIPVKIVSVRPPKYARYNSFPVTNGDVNYKDDLYSPKAYKNTSKYISQCYGDLKTYPRCEKDLSTGQIFIYSHGMNYRGYYKESTIVDQKLTVSLSLGYVAVRKPSTVVGGVSKALIRAHDACGRVCQVACRNPVTNEDQICSGAVAVSEEKPLMFGYAFDEAVLNVIDYTTNIYSPKLRLENIYLTFYCDYRDLYPFAELPTEVVPKI